MHLLRQRLKARQPEIGTSCCIPDCSVAEILGGGGFDFLLIEAEHRPIDRERIEDLIRVSDAAGMPAIVRVPTYESHWIGSVLDAGAAGIVVPRIRSVDEVRAVADAARFPPLGKRGVGPGRATGYGQRMISYFEEADANLLVVIQIETAEAIDNIAEIAAVPGIDVLLVGPGDLSVELEEFGKAKQPRTQAAIDAVISVARQNDLSAGTYVFNLGEVKNTLDRGLNFVVFSGDFIFLQQGMAAVEAGIAPYRVRRESE